MEQKISSTYVLLKTLREFLYKKYNDQFWTYSKYNLYGRALIKNKANEKRYLFNPWDSEAVSGKRKLQNFLDKTREFQSHIVDTYIFIGREFRDNAKQYSRVEKNIVLVEVNFENKYLILYGSMNMEAVLLNAIIEFAVTIGFEISYDFEGILKHRNGVPNVEKVEKRQIPSKVFISYSWDSDKHRRWVLKLAADLIKNGIHVLIDEWDLEDYRNDLQFFMESGIRESDFVIIICTPNYAERANARIGGVGVENTIITGDFYNEEKGLKYIPIARLYDQRITDCLPTYLRTKFIIDFRDDKKYDSKLEELIRKILNIPKYKRPQLGKQPSFASEEI